MNMSEDSWCAGLYTVLPMDQDSAGVQSVCLVVAYAATQVLMVMVARLQYLHSVRGKLDNLMGKNPATL